MPEQEQHERADRGRRILDLVLVRNRSAREREIHRESDHCPTFRCHHTRRCPMHTDNGEVDVEPCYAHHMHRMVLNARCDYLFAMVMLSDRRAPVTGLETVVQWFYVAYFIIAIVRYLSLELRYWRDIWGALGRRCTHAHHQE